MNEKITVTSQGITQEIENPVIAELLADLIEVFGGEKEKVTVHNDTDLKTMIGKIADLTVVEVSAKKKK